MIEDGAYFKGSIEIDLRCREGIEPQRFCHSPRQRRLAPPPRPFSRFSSRRPIETAQAPKPAPFFCQKAVAYAVVHSLLSYFSITYRYRFHLQLAALCADLVVHSPCSDRAYQRFENGLS